MSKYIEEQQAEIERLKKYNAEYKFCNLLGKVLVYSKNLEDYNDMRNGLISYGRRTFAKKLRQKIVVMVCSPDLLTLDDYGKCIDDVLKEMEDDSSE